MNTNDMILSGDLIWWITLVEIPAIAAVAGLFWRLRDRFGTEIAGLRRELTDHRLEVAQHYASVDLLKDTEKRLTSHLLRIEAKLDSRSFTSPQTSARMPSIHEGEHR